MNFKKIRTFFSENRAPVSFGAHGCHPSTLIDLVNTALAHKGSVKPFCMISEGYRTYSGVTGPMNFKKSGRFFSGKSCSRDFGAPGCHPDTLIDLANIALASRVSKEPISMIYGGYRTHRGVTVPMDFKSRTFFFFGKSCSRDFWAPGVHPGSLIDLVKFALASRDSVKTICMFSEG